MIKRSFIYALLFMCSYSIFAIEAMQENGQANQDSAIQVDGPSIEEKNDEHGKNLNDNDGEVPKKPTTLESWRKVVTLQLSSLNRDDVWNIGKTVTIGGIVCYLCSYVKGSLSIPGIIPPTQPFGGIPPQQGGHGHGQQGHTTTDDDFQYAQMLQRQFDQEARMQQPVRGADQLRLPGWRSIDQDELDRRSRDTQELRRLLDESRQRAQVSRLNQERLVQQEDADLAEAIRLSALDVANQSAISQTTSSDESKPELVRDLTPKDCDICADTKKAHQFSTMPCCQYSLCTECLMEYLNECLNKGTEELKCPNQGCLNKSKKLEQPDMLLITGNNNVYQRYLEVALNEALNQEAQVKQCRTPDCKFRYTLAEGAQPGIVTCYACKKKYCSHCCYPHDLRITCDQATRDRKLAENPELAEQASLDLIANTTKQCVQCGDGVERNQGCNHMTCKCGYEFCYICGKRWGDMRTCGYYNHQ